MIKNNRDKIIELITSWKGVKAFCPTAIQKQIMPEIPICKIIDELMIMSKLVTPMRITLCPECSRTVRELKFPRYNTDIVKCICGHEFYPDDCNTTISFYVNQKMPE